jgi:hypothetical protein
MLSNLKTLNNKRNKDKKLSKKVFTAIQNPRWKNEATGYFSVPGYRKQLQSQLVARHRRDIGHGRQIFLEVFTAPSSGFAT